MYMVPQNEHGITMVNVQKKIMLQSNVFVSVKKSKLSKNGG